MARKKISEFRAKTILYNGLDLPYDGVEITPDSNWDAQINSLSDSLEYVVKVDQGVKKRGKQGLVKVKVQKSEVKNALEELKGRGFDYFIIEEFVAHEQDQERYLAVERTREGLVAHFSEKGGIDIEENKDSIKEFVFSNTDNDSEESHAGFEEMINVLGIKWQTIQTLLALFDKYYFSFLELNPFLIHEGKFLALDAAVEVDSAAEFFLDGVWSGEDFRSYSKNKKTPQEVAVAQLADKSQASFSLTVLNPNGALCMLLSGGGASIVLADEAHNQGRGNEVVNYGEYSGNPNAEETYIYTKEILDLLLSSMAPKKALIIAGGVANFTDIRATFKGVIQAVSEYADKLREANIKVFVRRGGPNQNEGLRLMREFLVKEQLYGNVQGPDMVLSKIVTEALEEVGNA